MRKPRVRHSQERQVALYDYLLSRGNNWTSMEQVTDSINLYPAFFLGYYHNSFARRLLTMDIRDINESDTFNKIIVSGGRGIKLGTEKETEHFIRSEIKEALSKLEVARKLMRKCSRDQQITLDGEIKEVFLRVCDGEPDD